jgi:hypothetical protein
MFAGLRRASVFRVTSSWNDWRNEMFSVRATIVATATSRPDRKGRGAPVAGSSSIAAVSVSRTSGSAGSTTAHGSGNPRQCRGNGSPAS